MKKIIHSLFWRISGVFLILLLMIGLIYMIITAYAVNRYYAETTQRLNAHVAEHMLLEVSPFVDGKVNEEALHKIMHSVMALNPAIEVYLLDNDGKILSFVVLDKKVKLKYVSPELIRRFLVNQGKSLVLGDDPRTPGKKTVFSVTTVKENGKQRGFVYIVLASEEYEHITSNLWNSYLLRLAICFFILTLVETLALGLLMIWLLIRKLRIIIQTVKQFEEGDLQARIPIRSKGELANLSITFNKMADTLLQNIEQLKEVDTLRRELIANVSHDLRTPLAVIHGYVETLLMKYESLDQAQHEKYLKIILESSERLKRLVADLFELSKLETRQVKLHKEAFSLRELLQDTQVKYHLLAQERDVEIVADFGQGNPIIYADLAMMERVIQNLLDNAIKFTPPKGKVCVQMREKGNKVEIGVINTGEGIREEDLPKIFDRYYKVEKHYGANKGTGLGLAIVKNILEVHNSTINVKSKWNEYANFHFSLPIV